MRAEWTVQWKNVRMAESEKWLSTARKFNTVG